MVALVDQRTRAEPGRTRNRVIACVALVILAFYLLVGSFTVAQSHHLVGVGMAPLACDFATFHEAARLALKGRAAEAYDDARMVADIQAAFPGSMTRLPWHYPPLFFLLLLPFGLLAYAPALILWLGASYGGYALVARKLSSSPWLWLLLLMPGAATNLYSGQNGLLSVALMGGGVLLLKRRPLLAGALLALMAYKPHLAILIPFALLAGREWRPLAAAAATGSGLIAVTLAAFGVEPWLGFLRKAAHPSAIPGSSTTDVHNIPSVLGMLQNLGFSAADATIVHWVVATTAGLVALWVWRRSKDTGLRGGALALGALIATPYLRNYDMALLILPIAALASRPWLSLIEKIAIVVAWLLPVAILADGPLGVQIAPFVLIALLGLIARRAAASSGPST